MIDYSEKIVKELEYNFKGNRRYQTVIFIADIPTTVAVKEICDFVHSIEKRKAIGFISFQTKRSEFISMLHVKMEKLNFGWNL
jgi:hypothetical protein